MGFEVEAGRFGRLGLGGSLRVCRGRSLGSGGSKIGVW